MKKDNRKKITLRLNDEQYRKMLAKKNALNFSKANDFFISLFDEDKNLYVHLQRVAILKLKDDLLISEFKHQGHLLNQIARKANTDTSLGIEILSEIKKLRAEQQLTIMRIKDDSEQLQQK